MTMPALKEKFTIEDITLLKEEKKKEVDEQKEVIYDRFHAIFAPLEPANSKAESLMRTFNTGMAVYDGVMLGMKAFKRFKSYFRKKRK